MRRAIEREGGFFWVKCICHALHNAVKAGIAAVYVDEDEENPTCMLTKVKAFVTHIRRSPKQAEVFKNV
jgi:hypothetical protein